jgi:RNA polymerase primary sigma factor/RNA polymerase sigma factor
MTILVDATEAQLFPPGWNVKPNTKSGLDRETEILWFARLAFAHQRAAELPDSVWQDRVEICRNYIAQCNIDLAYHWALRSCRKGQYGWEDTESAAMSAFGRAVDRFDLKFGVRFSTYASQIIITELKRAFKHNERYRARYRQKSETAKGAVDRNKHDGITALENAEAIKDAMEKADLTKQESRVIQLRYYEEETLEATGVSMGLSKERIRQIQAKALGKLREAMGDG